MQSGFWVFQCWLLALWMTLFIFRILQGYASDYDAVDDVADRIVQPGTTSSQWSIFMIVVKTPCGQDLGMMYRRHCQHIWLGFLHPRWLRLVAPRQVEPAKLIRGINQAEKLPKDKKKPGLLARACLVIRELLTFGWGPCESVPGRGDETLPSFSTLVWPARQVWRDPNLRKSLC